MDVRMKCHCGTEYIARSADLKRGWGRACSKSCAARVRDFGKPKASFIDEKVKQVTKSPSGFRKNDPRFRARIFAEDSFDYADPSWDAHKDEATFL